MAARNPRSDGGKHEGVRETSANSAVRSLPPIRPHGVKPSSDATDRQQQQHHQQQQQQQQLTTGPMLPAGRLRAGQISPPARRSFYGKDPQPGPASYTINARFTRPSPPSFSFGSHLPASLKDSAYTPGPGAYSLRGSLLGPSFSISGRESDGSRRSDTPGPGAYHKINGAYGGPAFSLAARLPACRRSASPGPGDYHHVNKPAGPAFSLLSRLQNARVESTPGPGAYNNPAASTSRPSSPAFSITSKAVDRSKDQAPGPGSYSLPTTLEGPSFSLLAKVGSLPTKASDTPGPGRYNLRTTRPDSPAFSFGTKLIDQANAPDRSRSPGPGQYYTRGTAGGGATGTGSGRSSSLSFTFGMRVPGGKRAMGPGPGSYEYVSKPGGPAHSLHWRFDTRNGANGRCVPGPGAYNVVTKPDGPAMSLGGRTAVSHWHSQTPGPGAYEPSRQFVTHAAPKFSLGHRLHHAGSGCGGELETRPGPGAYSPFIRSGAPAFSMLSRF